MSVLITGGAGFIGSHTAVEFLNAGYDIVIVDNFSNSKPIVLDRIKQITGKDFRFYEVDLLDREALERVFIENPDIDSCIHFAGLKAVGESVSVPLSYYYNNLTGSIILCQLMQKYNVKTIVFSSSATVYAIPKEVPIKETATVGNATNPYGETKVMIERILSDLYNSDFALCSDFVKCFAWLLSCESHCLSFICKDDIHIVLNYIVEKGIV